MEALTGSPRAIYLTGFDSFEALENNEEWLSGDAATDAKFDALDAREAPYISEVHHTIWNYRPDLSNNVAGADVAHSHYCVEGTSRAPGIRRRTDIGNNWPRR